MSSQLTLVTNTLYKGRAVIHHCLSKTDLRKSSKWARGARAWAMDNKITDPLSTYAIAWSADGFFILAANTIYKYKEDIDRGVAEAIVLFGLALGLESVTIRDILRKHDTLNHAEVVAACERAVKI